MDSSQPESPEPALSLGSPRQGAPLSEWGSRAVVEGMSHGAVLYDTDGVVVLSNPSAERILGLGRGELIGTSPLTDGVERVREDEAPLAPDEHPAIVTLRTGVPLDAVVIGLREGQRRIWVSINTRPVLDPNSGKPVGVVGTFSDFTRRRTEISELERLSLVARRTDDVVIVTDAEGRIQWGNAALLALTGHDLKGILGRRPGGVLQGPESDAETIARMRAALAAGEGWSGELLNYRKDGTPFWHEFAISPARNGANEITHFVSIGRDITARKTLARRFLQLSAIVEASVDGIAVIDAFQEVRFANTAFARVHGYESGASLQGRNWRAFYPRDQLDVFDRVILHDLYVEGHWQGELTARKADGTLFPLELTVSLLSGGMVMVVRDITDRRRATAEQARLTAILEATPDLIAMTTIEGEIPYINAAGRRMLGLDSSDNLRLESLFAPEEQAIIRDQAIPFAVDYGVWSGETVLRTSDTKEVPVSQVIIAHKNDEGIVEYLSTIMRDITERKESEDALRRISVSDALTGLCNRRGFMMLAQQQLNIARQHVGHTILLYFDLNDFKPINDTWGHQAGDEALQEVARILEATFRDSDVIGRLGGDEFVVLAVNCLDPTGAVLLDRFDHKLAERNARGATPYRLSIGRGLARFEPDDPRSLAQLLESADRQLYEDKRRRKARTQTAGVGVETGR
ncbi:MAG: PAS domain S-box protein [Gemmatimonadota bacterium]